LSEIKEFDLSLFSPRLAMSPNYQ